jgi:DNA-directed RNA polymerase omega subunit
LEINRRRNESMKLDTMEKALEVYPNRFQLTMMAVARAREINEGDNPLFKGDDHAKPVVAALFEISEGMIVPATQDEMAEIREAKRIIREKALMEAREQDEQQVEEKFTGSPSMQAGTSEES